MTNLLIGTAIVLALWWGMRWFARANPAKLAQQTQFLGGLALIGLAIFLFLRGRIDVAMLVGSFGLYLIGYGHFPLPYWGRGATPTPGRKSRVRSAMLDMVLDHDSGAMNGEVLAGKFVGRSLDQMSQAEIMELAAECQADFDSLRLIQAYADRRFPGWRQAGESDADSRQVRHPRAGAMTKEEAYQILGLQPGASEEEIRAAHRALMKRVHPDQGGSTFLAAKVNEAKDVLLSRH